MQHPHVPASRADRHHVLSWPSPHERLQYVVRNGPMMGSGSWQSTLPFTIPANGDAHCKTQHQEAPNPEDRYSAGGSVSQSEPTDRAWMMHSTKWQTLSGCDGRSRASCRCLPRPDVLSRPDIKCHHVPSQLPDPTSTKLNGNNAGDAAPATNLSHHLQYATSVRSAIGFHDMSTFTASLADPIVPVQG